MTDAQVASEELLSFVIQFFELYPEYKQKQFYLTGESYAGKYLPLFAHGILEHNKRPEVDFKIPLVSTMIIDPYPSPVIQRTHMHLVPHALGIVDDNNMN